MWISFPGEENDGGRGLAQKGKGQTVSNSAAVVYTYNNKCTRLIGL